MFCEPGFNLMIYNNIRTIDIKLNPLRRRLNLHFYIHVHTYIYKGRINNNKNNTHNTQNDKQLLINIKKKTCIVKKTIYG